MPGSKGTSPALAAALFRVPPAPAQDQRLKVARAFGTAAVAAKPLRIATLGWSDHEGPPPLGVAPLIRLLSRRDGAGVARPILRGNRQGTGA